MTVLLVELSPDLVVVDSTRFPDRDQSHIFEHLKHYCSLFDPLPAIEVKAESGGPVVMRGHKYLEIARQLGRPTIRALIHRSSDAAAVEALLSRPDVAQLDWRAIDAAEQAIPFPNQWHVFFFERPLGATDRECFHTRIVEFLSAVAQERLRERVNVPSVSAVLYDDSRNLAQFQAPTPVGDESWFAEYISRVEIFDRDCARIVSYQGTRFER
jgi:hypothetical protein